MHTETVVRHTVYNSNSTSLSGLKKFGSLFFIINYITFYMYQFQYHDFCTTIFPDSYTSNVKNFNKLKVFIISDKVGIIYIGPHRDITCLQRFCYSLIGKYHIETCYEQMFNPLAGLCS